MMPFCVCAYPLSLLWITGIWTPGPTMLGPGVTDSPRFIKAHNWDSEEQ